MTHLRRQHKPALTLFSMSQSRGKGYNIKLSRSEICVANFIPPANGASQSKYQGLCLLHLTGVFPSCHHMQVMNTQDKLQLTILSPQWDPSLTTGTRPPSCLHLDISLYLHVEQSLLFLTTMRGCANVFFQLNLLPHYSLCSQGDYSAGQPSAQVIYLHSKQFLLRRMSF